ncbi:hypothetical protein [Flavobacterium sp. W21_SRS_FM6]|uniref:hypothetical protein n=1 Tax=Flavobacterium sp. W21_SRS_FM6 TaxID=3240268 RepID=UPI003F8EE2C5
MELYNHLKTVLRHPTIIRPYKRILLLSHMRANTSLFGHILGSNPEIEGYYELHIGYYSWKSFIRQKLVYFAEHQPKKEAVYIFDKVLHNEHTVNVDLFDNDDIIIIMVREPLATIKSIQQLFSNVDKTHECNRETAATEYYIKRLKELTELARRLEGKFYFLNADDLTQTPDTVLPKLTNYLQLKTPINKKYQLFEKTGKEGAGDSSKNMTKGELQAKIMPTPVYSTPAEQELGELYQKTITILASLALAVVK